MHQVRAYIVVIRNSFPNNRYKLQNLISKTMCDSVYLIAVQMACSQARLVLVVN